MYVAVFVAHNLRDMEFVDDCVCGGERCYVFDSTQDGGVDACVCGIGGDTDFVGSDEVVEGESEVGCPVCVASHFDSCQKSITYSLS